MMQVRNNSPTCLDRAIAMNGQMGKKKNVNFVMISNASRPVTHLTPFIRYLSTTGKAGLLQSILDTY